MISHYLRILAMSSFGFVCPTILALSRERRESHLAISQTEARRSSVCSALLCHPLIRGSSQLLLKPDSLHHADRSD